MRLKHFSTNTSSLHPDAGHSERRLQIATAALLTEVMRMDSEIKDDERQVIEAAVRERFLLNDEQAAELTIAAEQRGRDATDY
ncbi:MAG: TerB family tellurite resistance protein [Burkholderiales bacterium]|nr:TerB family tellurite resistance protein [Burkholderiales bacterium]